MPGPGLQRWVVECTQLRERERASNVEHSVCARAAEVVGALDVCAEVARDLRSIVLG